MHGSGWSFILPILHPAGLQAAILCVYVSVSVALFLLEHVFDAARIYCFLEAERILASWYIVACRWHNMVRCRDGGSGNDEEAADFDVHVAGRWA